MQEGVNGIDIRRIVVPTDFTAESDRAFNYALSIARRYGASVDLLHVMDPFEGDAFSILKYSPEASATGDSPDTIITRLLWSTIEKHDTKGVQVDGVKQRGRAIAPTVVKFAEQSSADLLVLGLAEHRGLGRLFSGDVAEDILKSAPCAVLVVRGA